MKTIILSGGSGYRLKEETEFKPKPLISIGGKPILWHIMKNYASYGFNEFIIALGYKGDLIKQYFLDQRTLSHNFSIATKSGYMRVLYPGKRRGSPDAFKITFVDTGIETLPGERILRLQEYITDDHFMVTYGDQVSDVDIRALVRFHKKQNTIGTLTAVHPRSNYGLLRMNDTKRATGFREKPVLSGWVSGGFMVFQQAFFSYVRSGEMEYRAFERLISKKQLSVHKHKGFWFSIDTYKDIDTMEALWQTNPPWKTWK